MGKYLKYFNNISEYNTFKTDDNYILPNVSSIQTGEIFYEQALVYKTVDLGLPSGILWADRNIGATSPEDGGLLFQWSDITGYTVEQVGVDKNFYWDDYVNDSSPWGPQYVKYGEGTKMILDIEDDAARANMGDQWRMPTHAELKELTDNTTAIYIDLDGNEIQGTVTKAKGVKLVSNINGNSIFLPMCGYAEKSKMSYVNSYGNYWSSELSNSKSAYCTVIMTNRITSDSYLFRSNGQSVRGVCQR